jgi:hypothetical protein
MKPLDGLFPVTSETLAHDPRLICSWVEGAGMTNGSVHSDPLRKAISDASIRGRRANMALLAFFKNYAEAGRLCGCEWERDRTY